MPVTDPTHLEGAVHRALAHGATSVIQPTGLDRDAILDVLERIVRAQVGTAIQTDGHAVDTVTGKVYGPYRWAAGAAVLLRHGRIADLTELVCRAVDVACAGLADLPWGAGFEVNELAVAYHCLGPLVGAGRTAPWKEAFAVLTPEALYKQDLEKTTNWIVYISAGESLRETVGLAPAQDCLWGHAFFDTTMTPQLEKMSDFGMYRDPNDPITYDITTRLKYATALHFGYAGPLRAELDEHLRRAGLATLLFLSPDGHVPFGGRSDQSPFQEAMAAALCELEARRYGTSDPALAGAFKRQARLCVAALNRWLAMEPPRSIKNGYPPAAHHGYDQYRNHSSDIDFTASLLGLALLFADESVAEAPCPADAGGTVLALEPAFHKVFAAAGDVQVEVDTAAQMQFNATGLGRVVARGAPLELGLAMPLPGPELRCDKPVLSMAPGCQPAAQAVAIGPSWLVEGERVSLATLGQESGLTHRLEVLEESPASVRFRLVYTHEPTASVVTEEVALAGRSVQIRSQAEQGGRHAEGFRFTVPILCTDGESKAERRGPEEGTVAIDYQGHQYRVDFPADAGAGWDESPVANRHGLYHVLRLDPGAAQITLTLTFA